MHLHPSPGAPGSNVVTVRYGTVTSTSGDRRTRCGRSGSVDHLEDVCLPHAACEPLLTVWSGVAATLSRSFRPLPYAAHAIPGDRPRISASRTFFALGPVPRSRRSTD